MSDNSAKPLYIDGLTQEQRTLYVRCASLTGQKLNAWVAETLDREAASLFPARPEPEPWNPPAWAEGLSQRAAEVLQRAGLDSREAVAQALVELTEQQWRNLPNCGLKTYREVQSWIVKNG